ncbi:hypothetical protein [Parafannyhessea umbonata]|uniref:Nucleotidyl transferase AbiEii/AbiGii toxin family protein n=1 Tax=Parafannyhessea umbonata TaxID=604330 RepID=A0A1H9N9E6_9ACTN|nr:hypothetical protein [Parafannyhessea umbonata]SER32670.1 hypothetical protein SAMN05216446_0315 [Parafannyhessea umbonata]
MSVVAGIDAFRDAMAGFEDKYVLIGGGACSLLFEGTPQDFRPTKDLDVVVMAATDDVAFGRALWSFVRTGGYACGVREDGSMRYYRFTLPAEVDGAEAKLPAEIELFSKAPWPVDEGVEVVPMPFDGDLSSLSAILLDENYFEFVRQGIVNRHGVPVPDVLHIIPLKMRAHMDLNRRHDAGEHVRRKNLTKHRSDVLSLSDLLTDGDSCALPDAIVADVIEFLDGLDGYARTVRRKERPRILEAASFLKGVYGL